MSLQMYEDVAPRHRLSPPPLWRCPFFARTRNSASEPILDADTEGSLDNRQSPRIATHAADPNGDHKEEAALMTEVLLTSRFSGPSPQPAPP